MEDFSYTDEYYSSSPFTYEEYDDQYDDIDTYLTNSPDSTVAPSLSTPTYSNLHETPYVRNSIPTSTVAPSTKTSGFYTLEQIKRVSRKISNFHPNGNYVILPESLIGSIRIYKNSKRRSNSEVGTIYLKRSEMTKEKWLTLYDQLFS